jgi:uncharacterized protein YbaP (TraB family)
MLLENLDRETQSYLEEILAEENTTSRELIKTLIRDRWQSMRDEKTTQSRNKKEMIANYIRKKSYR